MPVTPYISDTAVLTAAATVQGVAVPALTRRIIKSATVTNTTAAPLALTVHMVPATASATAANVIISAMPIPASGNPGSSQQLDDLSLQGLNAGGTLQALGLGLNFKYTAVDIV